jgi:polysaccharide chain length determinant protein (PEP-CTERM system associated)
MQNALEQPLTYLFGFWRYRWQALTVTWLVALIGWMIVYKLPDVYASTAQVYVDTDSILKPLLKGVSVESENVNEQFGLMIKELMSRPNLERVVRDSDLDINVNTPLEMDDAVKKLKKNIIIQTSNINSEQTGQLPNLFMFEVRNTNPEIAYHITKSLLDIFIEGSLGGSRAETEGAQKFLNSEIKRYEAKLIAAEDRLREFKRKNINFLPEQGSNYYHQLQQLQSNLNEVELQLREEINKKNELVRQLKNISPTQGAVTQDGVPVLSPIDQRILTLQRRLDELLLKYTEQHPDVIETKNSLKELLQQKQTETESGVSVNTQNPVHQQLQVSIGDIDANIAAIKVRRDEYSKRVKEMQQRVQTLPKIEAELKALNRDYEINKTNYDTLVARRESAGTAERAELTGEHVKMKVIVPPKLEIKPLYPNRLMLSTFVLLLAVGAGIGLAIALSKIKPVFNSKRELSKLIGLPVIGAVSFEPPAELQKKMRLTLIGYFLIASSLFIFYFSVMYFYIVDIA